MAQKATDPKDLVFGVYSILQLLIEDDTPTPDYSREVEDLHRELYLRLLPVYGISLLTIAAMRIVPDEPSWTLN